MPRKTTHGGRRADSGRHPIHDERMTRVTVHLTGAQVRLAIELGGGNVSRGVRVALGEIIRRAKK